MRSDWYKDFFSGLMVDFWANAMPAAYTQSEVDFLDEVFGPATGKHLLDVPCGHGRHAIALAKLGYRITGVDLSSDFLARASDAAGALTRVEWHLGDMRELPWNSEFDGAFCFGNSFGYLGRAGMRDFVAAVARVLKPGAHFVLEMGSTAESLLPALQPRRWMEVGDSLFFSAAEYDCAESRLDTTYSVINNGVRESKMAHTWIFSVAEIHEMLSAAGLEPISMYGSPAKEPFRLGSGRLILTARKLE